LYYIDIKVDKYIIFWNMKAQRFQLCKLVRRLNWPNLLDLGMRDGTQERDRFQITYDKPVGVIGGNG